jgi:hypothetical protein
MDGMSGVSGMTMGRGRQLTILRCDISLLATGHKTCSYKFFGGGDEATHT